MAEYLSVAVRCHCEEQIAVRKLVAVIPCLVISKRKTCVCANLHILLLPER